MSEALRPRDVVVTYLHHEEGKDFGVRLEHKPTKLSVEGYGESLDAARFEAQRELEELVQVAGV